MHAVRADLSRARRNPHPAGGRSLVSACKGILDLTAVPSGSAARLIGGFRGRRVVVVGDVMLDRFVWGEVHRISPEAPVPVVRVERESLHLGGAANVGRAVRPLTLSPTMHPDSTPREPMNDSLDRTDSTR